MVCVSHYTARAAERAVPGIKTAVVNNGVDYARFGAVEHIGGGGVLAVGAVKARKGVIELVRAMALVPGVRCAIVGSLTMEADYVERVRAEIARLDLGDRVILTGRVADAELLRYYAEADVFVMASLNVGWKFEGFGLTLLEASAAGLPVIGTTRLRRRRRGDRGRDRAAGRAGVDLKTALPPRSSGCWRTRRWRRGWALPGAITRAGKRGIASPAQMIGLYKAAISE